MGLRELQHPNIFNSSRNGEKNAEFIDYGAAIPLQEFYVIVEGENTERYYIKYLKEFGKLPFNIKKFENNVVTEKENNWKIIDGIKCLCGGDYWNKMKSIEKIYQGITSVPGMRPNVICIFDLDKCFETEDFFQAYKNVLLPLSKNEYIIFCASMPSIEYWFLTHYAEIDNDKFYKTASSVIKVLEKFDSELSKIKKAKTFWSTDYSKNWVKDILCEDEHLNRAISHAKTKSNHPKRLDIVSDRKDCDVSYSDMYKLFEIR